MSSDDKANVDGDLSADQIIQRDREYLRRLTEDTVSLRSKRFEFHGLEREFLFLQDGMLDDYRKSKDIKLPRDMGDERESILRRFLTGCGLFPKKYGITDVSARVVSTSGHYSREIDILFYDYLESIVLMRYANVLEYYPSECVHGVIQVKSRANENEIQNGLENIKSYKTLYGQPRRGFGILFAYESDLEWKAIIDEIESFAKTNPNTCWPNAVFVLDRGFFLLGDESGGYYRNGDIERVSSLRMFGVPDRAGAHCLLNFYWITMDLLRESRCEPVPIEKYVQLPFTAANLSYRFTAGAFAEIGKCAEHGNFARSIDSESLKRITAVCATSKPIHWIEAADIAYGRPPNPDAYARQPGQVRVYNPDNIPLNELLVAMSGGLAIDIIETSGMTIYLPQYYSEKEQLITSCPQCSKS